ncbi:hypothetical protein [Streptomyces sp. NBC_00286]|uniref:hypothetical protein n=1 Tax=Streptomyces sp. NBC_00286 TaxID=2975701 RepID=UPI002E2A3A20|nr:hypothetical protein [Streptomyces sp. NBC_00286]
MARLVVAGEDVVVRPTGLERLLGLRQEVRIPLAAVNDVRIERDWWRALRGRRRHGRSSPGRYCLGEWQHTQGRDYVAVRANSPAVLVDLRPSAPYARLAVSVPDPEPVAEAIRQRRDEHARNQPGAAPTAQSPGQAPPAQPHTRGHRSGFPGPTTGPVTSTKAGRSRRSPTR